MQKFKASELVMDFTLYPRGDVSQQHISYMVRSLQAGHSLPPIIVDKKSKRIVDGVHRWNAWRKFLRDDCDIECIVKNYADEKALFLDAVRLNAAHGVSLTTFDRTRCLLRAIELKIEEEDIADALLLTVEQVGHLKQDRVGKMRFASADGSKAVSFVDVTDGEHGNVVALKRTIEHMAGRTLTKRQVEINENLSGMRQLFYVNQLTMLIEGDLLDVEDESLMAGLRNLGKLIRKLQESRSPL